MTNTIEITSEILDKYVASRAEYLQEYYAAEYYEAKRLDGFEGTFGEFLYGYDEEIRQDIETFANA